LRADLCNKPGWGFGKDGIVRSLTELDVMERLRAAISAAGLQRAFADQHKISLQYVNDVTRGRREPGQKILDALGIERIVIYQEKSGNP
jgi:hypothetical protein